MKILLDARKIEDYGIGVYIRQLFQGIADSGKFSCKAIHLKGTEPLSLPPEARIEVSCRNYDWREHVLIPLKVRGLGDFWYFSPHYVFPFLVSNPLLVTVHDLIHFRFPHLFGPSLRVEAGRMFMRRVKRRARIVFAVSQRTKQDLQELFGFEDERVRVIYNGVAEAFFLMKPGAPGISSPYCLYVGNLKPHKNLETLLKAFARIRERYPEWRLVLIGGKPDPGLLRLLAELRLEDRVVFKGFMSQEEVIRFLDGAAFFVFPSLYEGFGLPPLEAMARRKAVISSPGGSLREILGENALYFDPESPEDLADKMEAFIEDESRREIYEERGYRHSLGFRWEKTVGEYIEALLQVGS